MKVGHECTHPLWAVLGTLVLLVLCLCSDAIAAQVSDFGTGRLVEQLQADALASGQAPATAMTAYEGVWGGVGCMSACVRVCVSVINRARAFSGPLSHFPFLSFLFVFQKTANNDIECWNAVVVCA